ncbi:hypothetical protein J6X96_01715 [bacterium]|nr:hypothetical protein [bacterium]
MRIRLKVCFTALFAISLVVYGNFNDIRDIDLLKSVEDLQAQVMEIKYQYVSITSSLEKIQLDIPQSLQNFPAIFNFDDQNLIVGPDGNIYFDNRDIRDYVCVINSQSENAGDSDTNNVDQTRSGYVTTEQFNQLADLVFTLSASCQTLRANLLAISNTVSGITQQMSMTSAAIHNLNTQCETLNQKHKTLDRVIDIKEDGRLILKLSPLIGNREPQTTPFLFQYPSIWSWEKICSKFNVATNSHLTSITLYCSDASKIPLPESVYVSAAEEQNGNYQMTNWYCTGVNTDAFPLITYTFTDPILIKSDRPHLLGIRKIDNNLIYPYVCAGYRNGGLFKPYGASEEEPLDPGPRIVDPPNPQDPPQMTLTQYMDMYFTLYMVPCFSPYEIWSVLHFSEDIDFTFNDSGLEIKKGFISEEKQNVLTDSNLGTTITNKPEILERTITWDAFCQNLRDYLITAAGGTVTGDLTVANCILPNNGIWYFGTDTERCDIIIRNSQGTITTENGNLNLSCCGQGSKIIAQKFLEFSDTEQCGKITIHTGYDSETIATDLTSSSVITVTPAQETSEKYWIEIDNSGTGTLKIDDEATTDLSFYFTIMRK